LKRKNEALAREHKEKRQVKAIKESFVTDIERCRESLQKINDYIANVDEYVKDKQESERKQREACEKIQNDIQEAKVKLVQIKSTISVQELSSTDVVKLNKENQVILQDIDCAKDRQKTLMESKYSAEMHFTKQIQKMNNLIVNYNDNMKKFFSTTKQLSAANKTTSIDTLSLDDALLVTGFKGTEKNHQNCILNIMPYFKKVVDELLEKNNELAEKLRNMRKRINQDEDTIADRTREENQLSQKLAKMDQDLTLQKQEHDEIDAKRTQEIENKIADLNMLKSCQTRSLADYQDMKKELTARLKSQTMQMENEQAQMVEDIREMAAFLYQMKNEMYENLVKTKERRNTVVNKYTAITEQLTGEYDALITRQQQVATDMGKLRDQLKEGK